MLSQEFKQSIIAAVDPSIDFGESNPEALDGEFEAAVYQLLWQRDYAESTDEALNEYVEQAVEQAQGIIEQWKGKILAKIKAIDDSSLSDAQKVQRFQEEIPSLYKQLDQSGYADILGELIAIAELSGRYEILNP
jgi:glutathionylspermidine synthase